MTTPRPDSFALRLALAAAALAGLAAATGALVPHFYARDPPSLQPQLVGQDLVTLLFAVPLVLASARLARRGSPTAHVLLLGGLLYLAYAYATYAFGVRFNALFLAYVAILGASTYAFLLGLARAPTRDLADAARARLPTRSLAWFLLGIALLFGTLWLLDVLPATLARTPPRAATEVQMPTSPIHVLDLAFVLPLSAAAGILLLRGRPEGPLLAGVMLVKVVSITLAMLSMGLVAALADAPVNAPVAAAATITLALALRLGWQYVSALQPPRPTHARSPEGTPR